ncbi:efflux RND transporter permease subunit [Butyricicoccus faecihominis]|uniref:efflux RND transporter permease subunit n=1 Tax=Butyricicoccus faecihominis TaxID=1712515 RepID=UPI002479F019|nr:efflux RND transporter permease subunit [Butyricicoccus faecihominis]MCQ5130068.1 efflux RND transporter permease subunit [Butyricicoccus faecihominis]
MKFAQFSIKHKVATTLAAILIVLFGYMSYNALPLALMPSMEIKMAVVVTSYSGAGPEEVENLVTRIVESACASVSGLDSLTSTSSEGNSMVMVQFTDDTDLDDAVTDLRDKVSRIEARLPDGADSPSIMKMDPDSMPVVTVGLLGQDLAELQSTAEDDIGPYIERLAGVASVDIAGGYENEVEINTFTDRLDGYGLTVDYIAGILAKENSTIAGGDIESGSQKLNVRTDGEYLSVEEIANTVIPLPAGGTVRLNEIADVALAAQDQDEIAKINGEPGITLSVTKQSGSNTVQVASRIKQAIEAVTADYPGLHWEILSDDSIFINQSVDSAIENIILGVGLAAIVLLFFLKRLKATAVIVVSMPICIVSVFILMRVMGITMNIMSLSGLALGVGMIVDNSIVVLENVFRFRTEGHSRLDSCVKGTGEVSMSIIASTMTTLAVFVPIGLSGGMVGMMFKDFALTIASLIASSLLVALLLVPLLCYLVLDDSGDRRIQSFGGDTKLLEDKPMMRVYRKTLKFLITRRKLSMLISTAMMGVFIVLIIADVMIFGVTLMSDMDESQISITVEMPLGSELEKTEEIADRVVEIAMSTAPEIDTIYYSGGGSSGMNSSGDQASITIQLKDKGERDRTTDEVVTALREATNNIAGAKISMEATSSMGSMTGDALSLEMRGDDYDALMDFGEQVVKAITDQVPDAVEVVSSASERESSVTVRPKRLAAAEFGLTATDIGSAVHSQLTGSTATELSLSGDEITVAVSGDSSIYNNLDSIKNIPISVSSGGTVPLSLVADVAIEQIPQSISREDQSRTVTISGDSQSGNTSKLNQEVNQVLATLTVPEGITIGSGGQMAEMGESFGSLGSSLLVALGLVYFVLAAQYESFLLPIMIMMIMPISLIGSLSGLPLTGNPISMYSIVGVVVLAGTVVNSAIVLVDYIEQRRKNGEDKNTAILNACPRRVRPVLMTTTTTLLGLMPMVFGVGEGSEMMRPMAIVMFAGMIISTVVTLLFTPVYYSLLASLSDGISARRGKHCKHGQRTPRGIAAQEQLEKLKQKGAEFVRRIQNRKDGRK